MADSKLPGDAPAFSNEIPSNGQELFVTFDDWKCKAATASTSEDGSSGGRYKFIFHLMKPQMVMKSISETAESKSLAQVSYHTFSTKIDVEVYPNSSNTQKFEMQLKSKLASKPEYHWSSPNLGGDNVTLQTQGALKDYFNFIIFDANAMPLARFTAAGFRGNWSSKKIGKLEIMPAIADKVEAVDEMVGTIMGLVYHHFMQINPTGALVMTSSSKE